MFSAAFYANVQRRPTDVVPPRKELADVSIVTVEPPHNDSQRIRTALISRIQAKPPTTAPRLNISTSATNTSTMSAEALDRRQSVPISIPLSFKRAATPSKEIGLTRSQPIDIPQHRRIPTAPTPDRAHSRYHDVEDDQHYRRAIEQWMHTPINTDDKSDRTDVNDKFDYKMPFTTFGEMEL